MKFLMVALMLCLLWVGDAAVNQTTCISCHKDESGETNSPCNRSDPVKPCSSYCFTFRGRVQYYFYSRDYYYTFFFESRGCSNFTDKEEVCTLNNSSLALINGTMLECDFESCSGNNCNNVNLTAALPRTVTATSMPFPTTPVNQTTCIYCSKAEGERSNFPCNTSDPVDVPCSSYCFTFRGRMMYSDPGGDHHITRFYESRGCSNFTDKEEACTWYNSSLALTNSTLLECDFESCSGNNCNSVNLTTAIPATATATSMNLTAPLPRTAIAASMPSPTTPYHFLDGILYPHGPQQHDNEITEDGFYREYRCNRISAGRFGFPFFGKRHYKVHICANGKIQLDHQWSYFWPRKLGRAYWWMRNMAIIAPFWAPVDEYVAFKVNHSKVYYQVYTDTEPNNNRTSDILKMASRHVQIYEESSKFANFSATWVLVVTWKNLCPFFYYGPRTFSYNNEEIVRLHRLKCRWKNTFQAVIITDGFSSFLMYNYPNGGIQWAVNAPLSEYRYWTQAPGIPVAGWNAGDNGNNTFNIKGSGTLVAMYNLDKKAGNTGFHGRYFWRIGNKNRKDAMEKCFSWINLQRQANIVYWYNLRIKQNRAMACPCTLRQALLDRRFISDWWFTGREGCFITRRPALFDVQGKTVMRQRCCYSTEYGSLLIGPANGGRLYLTPFEHRWNAQKVFYDSDQQAYEFCCFGSALCEVFYSYRPSDDCTGYSPPQRRLFWGDPHFITLDGANYTFNGLGEYVMIDAQNRTFQLQARTGLAQGNSTTATVFTAGAAKESNTATVEVRVRDGGGIEVLIDQKTYSGYNNLTNQSVELIDENLSISKPEENCFEVYFPSTTSLQFCVNKKMLSFVVAPAEIYKNTTKGLLGTWNDDPSDEFTLPNGTVLRSSSSLRDIHFGFGVEWQLTQVQSLFTYGENESVDTFARPDFVPMFSDNITWSDNSVRLAAEAQCGNDYECLFDVASTNDLSVGIVTKDTVAQLVNESNVLENFPPKLVNLPSALNATLDETVRLEINAEDDGVITFDVIKKPAGAMVNQSGNVLQLIWPVNSTEKINISFVATDDKGASTTWTPTINMCACQHGGQCVSPEEGDVLNTDSKFVYAGCACQDGYSGRFCDSDLDACEVSGQPCYAGVECIDLPPPANATGYICGPCPSGFTGNGAQCADIDECQSDQPDNCEQICVNVPGSFFCDCPGGYKLNADSRSCDDINECEPSNDCMQQCTNTQGSYSCSCDQFFTQDPNDRKKCIATHRCSDGHGCSQVCFTGADNQPTCACFANHELQADGKTCKDINECDPAKPRHRCLQLCQNTPGSYNCSCIKGFQLTKDGFGCEDVNECLFEELYSCVDEFHRCVNTLGSYKCECDQGLYFKDGKCIGLEKNESVPIPVISAPRVPSKEEKEESVQISISLTTNQYEWNFQTDKTFKEKTSSVTTSFCTQSRVKCALKEARRKRRALFDLYTADQVHLLPDYPRNASGSLQVAFYVQQPRGLFSGNTSILPGKTLVNIVKTYKSEIETALGANISRVEAFIQSPSTPTTTSPTTLPTKVSDSNDTTKWIAVGVGIGVFVLIFFILLLIFCLKKKKNAKVAVLPDKSMSMESLKKTSMGFENAKHTLVSTA